MSECGGTKKKSKAATLSIDARIDGPRPKRLATSDDPQQVDHDQIGFVEVREHQRSQRGADDHDQQRPSHTPH